MSPLYNNPDNPDRPIYITDRPHPGDVPPMLPANFDMHQCTYDQKRILAAMLDQGNLTAAVRVTEGVGMQRVRAWLRTDSNFQAAWSELGTGLLTESRAVLDSLLPAAADTYAEAMDAERDYSTTVECPHCGEEHIVTIRISDLKTRLAVADKLFKRSGDMAAQVKVSGEVKHRDMALEDKLAIAQYNAWMANNRSGGCPVPPDVVRSLSTRGLIVEYEPTNQPAISGAVQAPSSRQFGQPGQPGQSPSQVDEHESNPLGLSLLSLARYADSQDPDIPEGEFREVLQPSQD